MTDGQASISAEILARYAADAAREVDGVTGLAGRRGVRIERDDDPREAQGAGAVALGTLRARRVISRS